MLVQLGCLVSCGHAITTLATEQHVRGVLQSRAVLEMTKSYRRPPSKSFYCAGLKLSCSQIYLLRCGNQGCPVVQEVPVPGCELGVSAWSGLQPDLHHVPCVTFSGEQVFPAGVCWLQQAEGAPGPPLASWICYKEQAGGRRDNA